MRQLLRFLSLLLLLLLLLLTLSGGPPAHAWLTYWADTNALVLTGGTGPQTKHVATLAPEGGDGTLWGACYKANGDTVEWAEFHFEYVSVPPAGPDNAKVYIHALTGGPVPREVTCKLYEGVVKIADWEVEVNTGT